MTLPTIQPVDGPDWSSTPAFTTQTFNFPAVAGVNTILLEASLGYYAYAILHLDAQGDGQDYQVGIEILTANSSEGGSVLYSQNTVRVFGSSTIVPMSVVGQSIRLRDTGATAYPHNIIGSLTLYSAFPFQTGFPGGTWVINDQSTINAGLSGFFPPLGCAPGPHAVSVSTASPDWDLFLRVWLDASTNIDYTLALGTNGNMISLPFMPPASAWTLMVGNNDGSDWSFGVLVARDP